MDKDTREGLFSPLLVWLALLGLVALNCGYAFLPGAPAKHAVALGIAAIMIGLVGTRLVELRQKSALVQLAALGGVAWLSLLFLFSFADFLTR